MPALLYTLAALGGLALLLLLTAFICFMKVFYSPKRTPLGEDEYEIPPGEEYEEYRDRIIDWTKALRRMPYEELTVRSRDGLTLRGRYYECNPGGPVELLFHGYRGNAERDLSGGIFRCFAVKRNVILVNHRGAGDSEGHVITFGVKECDDCMLWIHKVMERFGKDVKIYLGGVSMGAATVMMASCRDLPENVVGILADCGYTSAEEIIKKVIKEMHLPVKLLYPFVKLGARLFGGFDLEATSPFEAVKHARVPMIFYHGDADTFVPAAMTVRCYEACTAAKKLVLVPGAAHGVAFPRDEELYVQELQSFIDEHQLP